MLERTRLWALRVMLGVDVLLIVAGIVTYALYGGWHVFGSIVGLVLTGIAIVWDRAQRRRIFGREAGGHDSTSA